MSMSEDSKQKAWLEHYQRLFNVEFDWDPDHLSYQPPVEGPPIPITIDMVKKAISQMKAGKAPGPSGIVVEVIRAASDMGASMIRDLTAAIILDGKVPSDWEHSFIVWLCKGKGGALERGNYRGHKLTEQVMKILEKIVDGLIRQLVSIDDSQFGSKMTGQWSDISAMSDHKTLSPPGPMSYLCGLALRIWTSFWRREDSDGMDMWNAPMVQSRQPLPYRLMESVGLGGPRWHGNSWQRGIAESGSSQPSALMIDIPGDLVWYLPCVQQASYLEGGPLVWMLPLYLHVNQKSDYDMMELST